MWKSPDIFTKPFDTTLKKKKKSKVGILGSVWIKSSIH